MLVGFDQVFGVGELLQQLVIGTAEAFDDGFGQLQREVGSQFRFFLDEVAEFLVGDLERTHRGQGFDTGGGQAGVEQVHFPEKLAGT